MASQDLVEVFLLFSSFCAILVSGGIFIDKGNPYMLGPLKTGMLTIEETKDRAPLHTTAFYPLQAGTYPPIFFVGGYKGLITAEFYEDLLSKVAAHGFVVFGVDTHFPFRRKRDANQSEMEAEQKPEVGVGAGADVIETLLQHLVWLRGFMNGRTQAVIAWNTTSLMCHSAGCDDTLQMIQQDSSVAKASVFLEPYSDNVEKGVFANLPILSYGTEQSEQGFPKCAVPGKDWRTFYDGFSCPKVLMEVKDFGHCDILDPAGWTACHDTHFCKTTNSSRNPEYHQFVQGVVSAFLIGTLEGYTSSLSYVTNRTYVPLELLDLKTDLKC